MCRIVKTMLAEKCGKQLPKAMGYLGLAWGLVMPHPFSRHIAMPMCRQSICILPQYPRK